MNGDFASAEQIVEVAVPQRHGAFYTGESRFIGRVWLRREVRWTWFAAATGRAVLSSIPIAADRRGLRRFKKGLCTRCAYPLPLEDEEPRCPECGTLHIP